jgi:hypothetical protein
MTNLSRNLEQQEVAIAKAITAAHPQVKPERIVPMYSPSVLAAEKVAGDLPTIHFSNVVVSKLNDAKTLMNRLGVSDITKAPTIRVGAAALRAKPGHLQPDGGTFKPNTWLENHSVITGSSLDLTNTNLVIDPSVAQLTIIVKTLTCGPGARITFATNWSPRALPQKPPMDGNSFPINSRSSGGPNDGQAGGAGQKGGTARPSKSRPRRRRTSTSMRCMSPGCRPSTFRV